MVSAQNCATISVRCWSSLTVWEWLQRVVQVVVQVCSTRCARQQRSMQHWMRWIESMSCSGVISTIPLTMLRQATSILSSQRLMYYACSISYLFLYMLTCFVSLMSYDMYFDLSDGCNLWPYCQTEWGGPSPPGCPCPRRPITWSPSWSGLEAPSWSTKQQMGRSGS